jgi:hypothetical protein
MRKISPPTGIRSPDRPARSKSLYRLSYLTNDGTHCIGGWVRTQGRSGRMRKISLHTGIRSPDRPASSELLYRLSYRGPCYTIHYWGNKKCSKKSSNMSLARLSKATDCAVALNRKGTFLRLAEVSRNFCLKMYENTRKKKVTSYDVLPSGSCWMTGRFNFARSALYIISVKRKAIRSAADWNVV